MRGTLRVTPDTLIRTAAEFQNRNQNVASITSQMMQMVLSLASDWEGEASAAYIRRFKGLNGDMQQIRAKLDEHAQDLIEMAENYKMAEEGTNVQLASGLSNDLIS